MFYLGTLLRTIAWETASQMTEEVFGKGKGGARKGVEGETGNMQPNIKRLLIITKNSHLK